MNEDTARNRFNKLPLMIIITIFISILSTIISLSIYKISGDIYIDRSRPGFISDEEKNEPKEPDNVYSFPIEGEVTRYDLDTFYEKLSNIDINMEAFSPDALSDDVLGINPLPADPSEDYSLSD
jgi:hypothetical protein